MYTRLAAIAATILAAIAVTLFGLSQSSTAGHPGPGGGHDCGHHSHHTPLGHTECPSPTSTVTVTVSPTVSPSATPTPPVASACPPANLFNAVRGTRRADVLVGTGCRDGILGHGGNDSVTGLAGNDVILGGRGDDLLIGGDGRDVLRGGFGRDTCIADSEDRVIRCEVRRVR